MRLPFTCFKCMLGLSSPSPIIWVEYQESNLYEYTCPNGHELSSILKQHKLEILFNIGMHAIIDGYYREAVASFASSLERFYEFFIKTKLTHDKTNLSAIDKAWKNVSKQSERQLGAFIFIYTQSFNEAPSLLSQNNTSFRNDVIHKGIIPSKADAMAFGQSILDIINPIAEKMSVDFQDAIFEIASQQMDGLRELSTKGNKPNPSSMNSPFILNVTSRHPDFVPITLEAGLKHMKLMKDLGAI